ncbi:MAG: hypothetical protein WAK60_01225 [Sedimentisphaerales bacterium]
MGSKSFSFSNVLGFGWSVMKANFLFFVGVVVVPSLISFVVSFLISLPGQILGQVMEHYTGRFPPFLVLVMLPATFIISIIIQIIVGIGIIKITLSFCDGLKPKFSTLFNAWGCFWRYVGAGLLYGLVIGVASAACALPFVLLSAVMRAPCFVFLVSVAFIALVVILSIKFSLCFYFVVDKGLGPINALRASSRATKGAIWPLFVFGIVCVFINMLGTLCFLVGLLATFPTVMVAMALVYRQLSEQTPELAELGINGPDVAPYAGSGIAGGVQPFTGMQLDPVTQSGLAIRLGRDIPLSEARSIQPKGGKKNHSLLFWLAVLAALGVLLVVCIGHRFRPNSKVTAGTVATAANNAIFNKTALTGIVYSEDNPSAIIGGKIAKEGDIINGMKVVKIHRDGVEFEKDGKKWTQRAE